MSKCKKDGACVGRDGACPKCEANEKKKKNKILLQNTGRSIMLELDSDKKVREAKEASGLYTKEKQTEMMNKYGAKIRKLKNLLIMAKCGDPECNDGVIYELSSNGCQEPKQCKWCRDRIEMIET